MDGLELSVRESRVDQRGQRVLSCRNRSQSFRQSANASAGGGT